MLVEHGWQNDVKYYTGYQMQVKKFRMQLYRYDCEFKDMFIHDPIWFYLISVYQLYLTFTLIIGVQTCNCRYYPKVMFFYKILKTTFRLSFVTQYVCGDYALKLSSTITLHVYMACLGQDHKTLQGGCYSYDTRKSKEPL